MLLFLLHTKEAAHQAASLVESMWIDMLAYSSPELAVPGQGFSEGCLGCKLVRIFDR
jgi:hypothetical protein